MSCAQKPYAELINAGTAPVLGIWGEKDHTMSVDDVRRVRDQLEDARRSYEFVMYPDLPHGWLNDTMPGRFRAAQAGETFELIVSWLHRRLSAGCAGASESHGASPRPSQATTTSPATTRLH